MTNNKSAVTERVFVQGDWPAVDIALKFFTEELKAQVVVWFNDNQSIAKIVTSGSKVIERQSIAPEIKYFEFVRHMT